MTHKVYDLNELKKIKHGGRESNLTLAQRDEMRANAVYVAEDEDYLVVKVAKGYAAIIGATLDDGFEINLLYTFDSRDAAVVCAISWWSSDAGGANSHDPAALEISTYASAWS